jgi:transcriptional regulator with XRE-family HTH domain
MSPCNAKHVEPVSGSLRSVIPDDFMRTYADILSTLVRLRNEAGVSQGELAKRMGRVAADGGGKQSTVSTWERGPNEMGITEIGEYAKALGWDVFVTLYKQGDETPEARFARSIDGLTPGEITSLLEAIDAIRQAPPDARAWALKLLRSTATTPR